MYKRKPIWGSGHKAAMDQYSLGDKLGQGSFGCVYTVIEKKTGRVFAMKRVLRRDINWTSKSGVGPIPMEVAVMSALDKVKGVVSLHHYFFDEKYVYIVMEKPRGVINLQQYLHRESVLTEEVAVDVFGQLAKMLYQMQQVRVVHGDLKLQNILVNPSTLEVYLIDFGQSYFLSQKRNLTWKAFRGTPDYAPPEMIRTGKMNLRQAEVWSLGVVLYTLVTGHNPFLNEEEIMLKRLQIPASVSEDMEQLILGLLHKWPRQRYTLRQTVLASKLMEDALTYHVIYTPTADDAQFKGRGYFKELRCKDCWKLAPMFSRASLKKRDAYVTCFYCKATLRNSFFSVPKHRRVCAKRPTKYSTCKSYCQCI